MTAPKSPSQLLQFQSSTKPLKESHRLESLQNDCFFCKGTATASKKFRGSFQPCRMPITTVSVFLPTSLTQENPKRKRSVYDLIHHGL